MSDIVKRLRRYCADTGLKSHTIDEAADEIERLREALCNIVENCYGDEGLYDCLTIARAALEERK